MRARTIVALALIALAPLSAGAQWLNGPTPGIPRLADGKPDLNAPAPRASDGKPDLSGVWRSNSMKYVLQLAADLPEIPLRPEGRALYDRRLALDGAGRPA